MNAEAPAVFVDTNVLVYARDSSEPDKQPRARDWLERLWRTRRGRLSAQVLHEYYATVTRKLSPGLSADRAREDVRDLKSWRPVALTPDLTEEAWDLEDRFSLSFWDALIAAAARRADCRYLLTEDLQDGQEIGEMSVISPFLHTPNDLL